MKRLLTILLLFISVSVFGQKRPAPSPAPTSLTTFTFSVNADSSLNAYSGTTWLWWQILSKYQADKLYQPLGSPVATPFSLSAGYGLSGSSFNGSVARTFTADTTSATGLVSKSRLATNLTGYVPKTTTLTINGSTRDLSTNRVWNVGTVLSVGATAGTGISIAGTSPITSSGTYTITNTAPDQTVVLNAGTGISTSGTYPNFTITNTLPAVVGIQDSLTKKANRTFDNVASGAIANIKLANSTISGISLGSNLANLSAGTGLSFTSYNGSTARTANADTAVLQTVLNFFPKGDTRYARIGATGTVTSVTGTANQISSTGGDTPVLSIPSTFIAPGSVRATTTLESGTTGTSGKVSFRRSSDGVIASSIEQINVNKLSLTSNGGTKLFDINADTVMFSSLTNGLVKSTSGKLSNAVAGTDYLTPTGSGSGLSGVMLLTGNQTATGIKTISDAISFPTTTGSGIGVIQKGTSRFIHNFELAGTDGLNTFVGVNSGNFTMTGSTSSQGSRNTAVGGNTLQSNTTGQLNAAVGFSSLSANTTGAANTGLGINTLSSNTTGNTNTAIGGYALSNVTTGSNNIAIGYLSGGLITTGSGNTIIGGNVAASTTITDNIILANGNGTIKAQHDATNWTLTGGVSATGSVSSTPQGTLYGTASGSITSTQLATSLTDETGTGSAVFSASPTLTTPNIGVATFTTLTGGTASTITFANTGAGSITDAISIRNGGTTAGSGNRINFITGAATQSARIASSLTSSTDANLVFSTMTGGTIGEAGRFLGDKTLQLTGALTGTSATFSSTLTSIAFIKTASGEWGTFNSTASGASSASYYQNYGTDSGSGVIRWYVGQNAFRTDGSFAIQNVSGTGLYLTSGSTSWTSTSDERSKDIIRPITNALNDINSWRTVIGKYKNDEIGKERIFLIAQDILVTTPQVVDVSDEGNLGLRYLEIIPVLVKGIQELKAEIEILKQK